MNAKRVSVLAIVLALGMVLGALLLGPANIALGQDVAREEFVLALPKFPPSPCNVGVQSTIITAEDGTATANLVAYPPNPCILLNYGLAFDVTSFPERTATCEEYAPVQGEGARVINCQFSAAHETTTFKVDVNPIGRRSVSED